jgi:type IV pilus assembly protein PilQ
VITTSGSQFATDTMINNALINRLAGRSSGLPVATPGIVGNGVLVPGGISDLGNPRLNVNMPVFAPAGAIGFSVLGADYLLDLELSALEEEGRGEVVSSPRVITANQREASIRQGSEIGYPVTTVADGVVTTTAAFKEALLELKVTPTITQDGRVYLNLAVKKDEVSGLVQSTSASIPQISRREVTTAVLVDNGQTVVVGGVYEIRSAEDLRKVPFLGDVPALGNLFRTKTRSTDKAELLIFVTPKVLAVAGRSNG